MIDFLIQSKEKGISLFKPEGYHMVADEDFNLKVDGDLIKEVTKGVRAEVLDKLMMFDCNKISNINYSIGCHMANPIGDIVVSDKQLKMLHYKFLGLEDHKLKQTIRGERLSEFNKQHGFGLYYLFNEEEQIKDYRGYLSKREIVL
jgi:hypothetical protein